MTVLHSPRLAHFQRALHHLTCVVGRAVSWCALLMVFLMVLVVVMRYGFGIGNIALQESITYLHGAVFMLCAGYTLAQDEHVRVDVLYQHWGPRRRALVNLLGTLFLLLPICVAIFALSLDYVVRSWAGLEKSDNGGLPLVFILKSLLLVMPVLLGIQAVADLLRHAMTLAGASQPVDIEDQETHPWT
ncbi:MULTISPECIES: TRAP transporter small permease subunit [Alloalcanivorax]|nr:MULTISPECIES: TRAP transporter small permease subunit [Alloalcanivorax]